MAIVLQAPVTIQLAISIINDETGQQGVATYAIARGRFHDEEATRDGLKEFEQKHMPTGFRLMTKREWFNSEFGQITEEDDNGNVLRMNIAMPGGEDWAP